MNYTRFCNDGLELYIDVKTGEVFASQSATARMVKVSRQAIDKWVTVNQIPIKSSEIITTTGLKTVNLLNEKAIYQAFLKYKPELLIKCAEAGL